MSAVFFRVVDVFFGALGILILAYQLHLFYLLSISRDWLAVPAAIVAAERTTSEPGVLPGARARDLTSVRTHYRYEWEGRVFTGDRLEFSRLADDFSRGRQRRQLGELDGWNAHVFVDPRDPSQSVFDRSAPIGQIAFASFFILFPCGQGVLFLLSLPRRLAARATGESPMTRAVRRFTSWLGVAVFVVCPLYALIFLTESLTWGSAAAFIAVLAVAGSIRLLASRFRRMARRPYA